MTFPLFADKKFMSPHRRRAHQVPVFEAAGCRRNTRDFHILHSVIIKLNLAVLRIIRNGSISKEPEQTSAGCQVFTIKSLGAAAKRR